MAWQDRFLPATYISPSGKPFIFQYENLSLTSDKKTTTFIFPEIDGAFIQDLGRAGRRFPLNIFFSGNDYDIIADAFLLAVEEKGIGTLINPLYGVKSVVTTGTISRRDDLLTSANQAAFTVTFSETLTGLTFPASIENITNTIKSNISLFQQASSAKFKADIIVNTANESISLKQAFETNRFLVQESFKALVKTSEDLNAAFQTIGNSLKASIPGIVDYPDIVSGQLITYIRTPASSDNEIIKTINTYESLVFAETRKSFTSALASTEPDNNFQSSTIQAFSCMAAACESTLTADFQTRQNAIDISEKLLNIFDDIKIWQDTNITALETIDTGESYDSLLSVIASTTAYLIDISFDLPSEKRLTLGEERNIIELVFELYEDLEKIDFFIQTNNLTADEIEILPLGKKVVYYV